MKIYELKSRERGRERELESESDRERERGTPWDKIVKWGRKRGERKTVLILLPYICKIYGVYSDHILLKGRQISHFNNNHLQQDFINQVKLKQELGWF